MHRRKRKTESPQAEGAGELEESEAKRKKDEGEPLLSSAVPKIYVLTSGQTHNLAKLI